MNYNANILEIQGSQMGHDPQVENHCFIGKSKKLSPLFVCYHWVFSTTLSFPLPIFSLSGGFFLNVFWRKLATYLESSLKCDYVKFLMFT